MGDQPNLFDFVTQRTIDDYHAGVSRYPGSPGYTDHDTSLAAAKLMAPAAQTLRDQVMVIYRAAWPAGLTADEVAAKLNRSILSIRPRVTELRKLGELGTCAAEPGPGAKKLTRKNESGAAAAVLVCKRPTGDR